MNDYDNQASKFLTDNGIKFSAVLKNTKRPTWAGDNNGKFGHHYRVTLTKPGKRTAFDFFDSYHAKEHNEPLTAYGVLACISGDVDCPDTFEEFCEEYGYEADSRKDYATFRQLSAFAQRLRAFFTTDELDQLREIR